MHPRLSKLAVLTFIMGCVGIFCAMVRAAVLWVFAIPLGPLAMGMAVIVTWLIRRNRGALRGRGLALWGGTLGLVGSLIALISFANLFAQQFDADQWRQEQAQQLEKMVRRRSNPKESAAKFSSNLPIIVLQGDVRAASKHREVFVNARFFDVPRTGRASVTNKPSHEGLISIHPRGTSSLQLPKHSYTIHTFDPQTNQLKVALLGMPKDDDWILYAPFEDKTLIRDVLAYHLSNKMGQYAPRTRYVELFIQNSGRELSMRDYEGVYVLIEKIKRGKDRVNVAKLDPEDGSEPAVSGGYILKRDHGDGSGKRFSTERGGPYFYVYPSERAITREQRAWLSGYFRDFEEALYGPNFADPEEGYAAYLDTAAFIDLHWLIEFSKNVDGFRYSSYLTKDRNGKIKPGPAWDWNRSFGNANYYNGWQTQGWYWRILRPNEISWYQRLRKDPAFEQRCRTRWRELRQDVLDPDNISATIDQFAQQLEEAQKRNFDRWPILGQQITCNHYVGDSFEDEVKWLKKWVERRIAWIDKQVEQPREQSGDDEVEISR